MPFVPFVPFAVVLFEGTKGTDATTIGDIAMTSRTTQKKLKQLVTKYFPTGMPKLAKLSCITDEVSGIAYDEYMFETAEGTLASLEIERGRASDYSWLHRELLNKNANIPTERKDAEPLIRKAVATAPKQNLRRAAAVGWQRSKMNFALHGRVLGLDKGLLPPRAIEQIRHRPWRAGDLKAWLEVAEFANYSSRLTLALCCAFAAPLLAPSGLQPFGVNLFGRSRAGKSTIALAAGSVIGFGDESQLPSWDVTRAGAQQLAGAFNDHLLVLNELAVARALRKRDAYELVRNFIYLLAEGSDATRHSASAYTNTGASAVWRVIFLSTSEKSISRLAGDAGLQRDEGEYARLWDVPAVRDTKATVFGGRPSGASSDWEVKCLARIRELCRAHHGVAFPPYIAHLLEKGHTRLKSEVSDAIAKFEAHVDAERLSGAVAHAAKNFGVIYAGGLQAIDAKLLPVSKSTLLKYIESCFTDGLATVSTAEALEARACRALRMGIKRTTWVSVSGPRGSWPALETSDEHGYRYVANRKTVYAVRADWFDRHLPSEALRCAAIRLLCSAKQLELAEGRDPERQGFTRGSYETFLKIQGVNQRFVQFSDFDDD